MKRLLRLVVFVTAVSATGPQRAWTAEPQAIAVLTFANQVQGPEGEDWDWLEKGLADLLINDLAAQPGLVLVDRERMQQTLDAMGAAAAGGNEERLIGAFVERFKVSRLVFGSYRVDGDTITLHAAVADAQTGRLIDRIEVKGEIDRLFKLQKLLSGRVAAALLGRADPEKIAASLPVWTESLPASKLFYEAVDYFDQGRLDESWLLARRALRMDPDYADALYWVGRMHYYLLQYPHARRYFEQFVYEYPVHARAGDAAVEFLDTYERGLSDPRARAEEIRSLMDRIPPETRIRFYKQPSWGVLFNYDLHFYLALRRAEYLIASTDYARATRELAPYFMVDNSDSRSRAALEVLERARMAIGQVLGQPTTLGTLLARTKDWPVYRGSNTLHWFHTFRVFPLRPGQEAIDILPAYPTDGADITRDLYLVPPNHQIQTITMDAIAKAPAEVPLGQRLDPRFSHEKGDDLIGMNVWRQPGHQSKLSAQYAKHQIDFNPFPAGKIYVVHACFETSRRTVPPRWKPKVDTDVTYLTVSTQLTPADPTIHLIVQRGNGVREFQINDQSGQPELHSHGPEDYLLGYLSEPRLNDSVLPYEIQTRHGATAIGAIAPAVGPSGWGNQAFLIHCVAEGYSPVRDLADFDNEASVTLGHEGQWVTAWTMGGDVWMSSSTDEGMTWCDPVTLPVPVNSAHREQTATLLALHDHQYALVFQSDRGMPAAVNWYATMTRDLIHWTSPRVIPIKLLCTAHAGMQGELVLTGFDTDENRRMVSAYRLGGLWLDSFSESGNALPDFTIARLLSDGQWRTLNTPMSRLGRNVERWRPLVAWYDTNDDKYHCIATALYKSQDPNRGNPDVRLVECSGTAEHGLSIDMLYDFDQTDSGNDTEYFKVLIWNKKLIFSGLSRYVYAGSMVKRFDGMSLTNEHKTSRYRVRSNYTLGAVTPDGRLIGGLAPTPPSDHTRIFSHNLKDTAMPEWNIPGVQIKPPDKEGR